MNPSTGQSFSHPVSADIQALFEAAKEASSAFAESPVETKFGELKAWRAWKVVPTSRGPRLASVTASMVWHQPVVTGEDGMGTSSEVFGELGHVGFYALKNYADLTGWCEHGGYVVGRVAMWGNVVEHENGYRAECMRILTLDPYDHSAAKHINDLRAFYLKGVDHEHRPSAEEVHGRSTGESGSDHGPRADDEAR